MSDAEGFKRRAFLKSAPAAVAGLISTDSALPAAAAASTDKFDFDTPYNRIGTDCIKWDRQIEIWGRGNIVAGMGIADQDFKTAPAITKALADRMKHENWGYLNTPPRFADAIIQWNKRRYGIEIRRELMLFSTGVHPSIVSALRAFSPQGSKVLLLTPTYDGFYGDIRAAGCRPEESPLKLMNGRYEMDLGEFERHIAADTKTLILCNPQNPTGNCWSPQDLTAIGQICKQRGVVILADEIHCDFVTKGNRYTPFSTLENREIVMNSITFKSASKSFSLSALKCGWMFSDNGDYMARVAASGHSQDFNTLGMVASLAAYTGGEEWLNQLVGYIDGNHDLVESYIHASMPLVKYRKPQGTYLAWLDVSAVVEKIGAHELAAEANRNRPAPMKRVNAEMMVERFFVQSAKVQINPGPAYGYAGAGHMRMNIATSRKTLELALTNMANALKKV